METKTDTSWRSTMQKLFHANEQQALELLNQEKAGQNRPAWLLRIYGRYSVLRERRERQELMGGRRRARSQ